MRIPRPDFHAAHLEVRRRAPSLPKAGRGPVAVAVALTCAALAVGVARAWRQQPPPDRVGACSLYATCRDAGCHSTYPLGSATLRPTLSMASPAAPLPAAYEPGLTYDLRLDVDDTANVEALGWGFQLAALLQCDTAVPEQAGTIDVIEMSRTALAEDLGLQYLSHLCTCPIEDPACCGYVPEVTPGLIAWTFRWTAPPAGSGDVTFNAAFNAVNRDGLNTFDRISLAEWTLPEQQDACPPRITDVMVRKAACDPALPGETRLELDWTRTTTRAFVRVTADRLLLDTPTSWALAGGDCIPLGPESLLYISVAEECASGAEGSH